MCEHVVLDITLARLTGNGLLTGADWGKKVARELLSDRPTQYTARCPVSTQRAVQSVHGALPTQCIARIDQSVQWPTWKNTHTLNIILDDYKAITSYMFVF